jgi:hypothetical protein
MGPGFGGRGRAFKLTPPPPSSWAPAGRRKMPGIIMLLALLGGFRGFRLRVSEYAAGDRHWQGADNLAPPLFSGFLAQLVYPSPA